MVIVCMQVLLLINKLQKGTRTKPYVHIKMFETFLSLRLLLQIRESAAQLVCVTLQLKTHVPFPTERNSSTLKTWFSVQKVRARNDELARHGKDDTRNCYFQCVQNIKAGVVVGELNWCNCNETLSKSLNTFPLI